MSDQASIDERQSHYLNEILRKIEELTDLFRRRLVEDKTKQRQLDELYLQLNFARDAISSSLFRPFVQEALHIVDRVEIAGEIDPLTSSVVEEMLEIFRRRGLKEIPSVGRFDSNFQEAVQVEDVEDPELIGQVLAVRREGYTLGGVLIRPAQVVVGQASDAAAPITPELNDGEVCAETPTTVDADAEAEDSGRD